MTTKHEAPRTEAHSIVDRLFDLMESNDRRYTDDALTTMVAMDIDAITNLVAEAWRAAGKGLRDE